MKLSIIWFAGRLLLFLLIAGMMVSMYAVVDKGLHLMLIMFVSGIAMLSFPAESLVDYILKRRHAADLLRRCDLREQELKQAKAEFQSYFQALMASTTNPLVQKYLQSLQQCGVKGFEFPERMIVQARKHSLPYPRIAEGDLKYAVWDEDVDLVKREADKVFDICIGPNLPVN